MARFFPAVAKPAGGPEGRGAGGEGGGGSAAAAVVVVVVVVVVVCRFEEAVGAVTSSLTGAFFGCGSAWLFKEGRAARPRAELSTAEAARS